MQIIKSLVEKIDEELMDAEKYIDCAYNVRDDYPELSAVYFRLSKEATETLPGLLSFCNCIF